MKPSPFFRQFSKPSLLQDSGGGEPVPTPQPAQMKPAQPPPTRSNSSSGFNTLNTAINIPITYTPVTNTTSITNNNSNNNNHNDPTPDTSGNGKSKQSKEKRNPAANILATKIVQKSTQRLRSSPSTADATTIAQAQQQMDAAATTSHIVITKRDPNAPPNATTPPPTVISFYTPLPASSKPSNQQMQLSSNLSSNLSNTLHPTSTYTTTTTTTTPSKPTSPNPPRRSIRNEKRTPLTAKEKHDYENILLLIEQEGKNLPLIWAAKVSIVPHLEFLISIMNREGVNIDINHQDASGKTALHYAASRGYKEICVILLKHHDCENYFTPLHHAARSKHPEIVELLLKNGADASIKDSRGLTVLHTTAGAGNQQLFSLLAKYCQKPLDTYKDKFLRTCLFSAIKYREKDMIYSLICNHNVDPFVVDSWGVHYCAMEQKYLFASMYSAYNSKYPNNTKRFVECVDKQGRTPLLYALRKDSKQPIKIVEFLIALEANVNVQDTKTDMAARSGPLYLVQLLLNKGALPNTRNSSGELPLDLAVHVDVISAFKKVTVASPKRKRVDSDSDGEYEMQTDPEPRKRNIQQLKHDFAGLKNPEKKPKEDSAFFGNDDDSTVVANHTKTHDIKKAVHHIHISSPSSPSSSPSSSPAPNTSFNTNNNNNNNNFNNLNVSNNNNFNINNNSNSHSNPVNNNNNNVFINNTTNNTNINTSIYNNTNILTNINTNVNTNATNNTNTSSHTNNSHNSSHLHNSNNNPSTEAYTNSAPLATQATPFPLDVQPLAVTLGPLAQQFIIVEADLVMGEFLGTGSFGEVVKGKWRDNAVAIKCMHKNLQSMQQAVTLYVNEIELMCRVRHPNVVRIFGCTTPPLVYIVMDYYPSNLHQLIHTCARIPTPLLLKIAKGIANGLFYLHYVAKIIHRDMKPSNVLLDDNNIPKIADFGVARDNAGTLTMTGIGTPTYMAPEMLKGRKYSDKVDVYSFGLMLWQMFTGQKPFADLKMNDGAEISPVQIAVKVATHRIRPKIPSDCPPSLSQLITQCWEHDPKKRLSSEELVAILEDV